MTEERIALKQLLMDNASAVIDGLIDGLGELGHSPDQWDSGTIEVLLSYIEDPLEKLGIPSVGNTGADDEALMFWCAVDGVKYVDPWDPYQGDEESARDGWKYELDQDQTGLPFEEWWAKKIEEEKQ